MKHNEHQAWQDCQASEPKISRRQRKLLKVRQLFKIYEKQSKSNLASLPRIRTSRIVFTRGEPPHSHQPSPTTNIQYMNTHTHLYVCICILKLCIYTYTITYLYTYIHIYIYTYIHIYICIYTYTYMHIHVYICIYPIVGDGGGKGGSL